MIQKFFFDIKRAERNLWGLLKMIEVGTFQTDIECGC